MFTKKGKKEDKSPYSLQTNSGITADGLILKWYKCIGDVHKI